MGGAFQRFDSAEYKQLAHTLTFSVNLAAFASLLTFVAVKTPSKRAHYRGFMRWGPWVGLAVAAAMVMFDLTRHIFLDAGLFIQQLHMYNSDQSLTIAGRVGMLTTWLGNALLIVSLIWFVLPPKWQQHAPWGSDSSTSLFRSSPR